MLWNRPRVTLAFDATAVWGVVVRHGLRSARLEAAEQEPLPAGALVPSPGECNLPRPAEVRDAIQTLRQRLDLRQGCAVDLVLPAGLARPVLLPATETDRRAERLRFRLGSALPFPANEAIVATMRVPPGPWLAAALRRSIVAEYESVTQAAGLRSRRVELATLLALGGLAGRPLRAGALDVILGETAVSFAVWEQRGLDRFHSRLRRRPGDDLPWLLRTITQVAARDSANGHPALRLAGSGATALASYARERGFETVLAWDLPQAPAGLPVPELAWLGGLLQ